MNYPSDISRERFRMIEPLLESARKKTRPRTLDLYEVFNGILYLLTTGCQWRALPQNYPKWRSVHEYFLIWSAVPEGETGSLLGKVLKKIGRGGTYRRWQEGRDDVYNRRRAKR